MTMSEIIAELRARKGYTVQVFADTLEVHPSSIRAWERGLYIPSMRYARRIKKYMKSLVQDDTTTRLLANVNALYPEPSESTTGQRLRELREMHAYTQYDFAKLLNVSPSTISFFELNIREMYEDTIKLIAQMFSVPADWLLGCLPEELTVQEAKMLYQVTQEASVRLAKRGEGNGRGV